MIIRSLKSLCILLLCITQLSSQSLAESDFEEFRDRREGALREIREGKTKIGLIKLINLSEQGDGVSSHALGLFYLKAHHVVRPNTAKAVLLFGVGATQCYRPSIKVLKENFWGKKTSEFFNPEKIKLIEAACQKSQKEAEEKRRAEAERKEAEEKRRAEAERKEAEEKSPKIESDDDILLDDEVVFAWSRVLPKFSVGSGAGSGFAISDDGYFITNHHVVVREECKKIAVQYNKLNGEGETIVYSEELDLALVKVNAPTPYFGKFDISKLKAGERLVALGYPVEDFFGKEPTISEGALTNASDAETQLRDEGFLFISVPITQGNSGGPIMSRNMGIRGIASYGFKSDYIEEAYKEREGISVNLASINLNFMVSGIRAYDWLRNNAKFIDLEKSDFVNGRAETQEIAEAGLKILAKIECYEE